MGPLAAENKNSKLKSKSSMIRLKLQRRKNLPSVRSTKSKKNKRNIYRKNKLASLKKA